METILDRLVYHRRNLHQIPEIDEELTLTFQYLQTELEKLKCDLISPAPNALCAYFDFRGTETIAFRSDMDALYIEERTTHSFKSKHEGKMHACGHDGHMALVLSLAEYIDSLTLCPSNNIMLIFQPAEETALGAKKICESGIFEKYNITKVFGSHIWPELSEGIIATKPGCLMAQCSGVCVEIKGKSAHIAKADEGKDAMIAAAKYLLYVYETLEKEVSKDCLYVLKFGKMVSGSTHNSVSESSILNGSMRTFDAQTFETLSDHLMKIATLIKKETDCSVEIKITGGCPPVINDIDLYGKVNKIIGNSIIEIENPLVIGEDFSYYSEKASTIFFLIGSGNNLPLHTDTFDFDEKILLHAFETYKKLIYII